MAEECRMVGREHTENTPENIQHTNKYTEKPQSMQHVQCIANVVKNTIFWDVFQELVA